MYGRHLRPFRHHVTRVAVAAAVATGLTLTSIPAAQAAPSDWTIVAHRGGSAATPEGTFAAFRYMLLRGVDAVEVDLNFTRDGVPVVMHDLLLDRTTDCTGPVTAITVAALMKCDAGSWFNLKFAGERVPTLAKMFNFVASRRKNFTYFLHVKITSKSGAKKIWTIAKKKGLQNRVVPISGSTTELGYLKKVGFTRVGYVFNAPIGWSSSYQYLIPYNVTSNPELVAGAHARGQWVLPVENHPHSAGALAGLDIDGILANDLDRALILAGRLAPKPGTTFQGEPGEPEPTTIPVGEPRTTGPNDF